MAIDTQPAHRKLAPGEIGRANRGITRHTAPPAQTPDPASPRNAPPAPDTKTPVTQNQKKLPPVSELRDKPGQWARNFLGASGAIPLLWGTALSLVFVDEWKANHILARPARLWYTSLLFFLLAAMAHSDMLRPLANALAIGFTLMLAYQFYSKQGQFTNG